MKIKFFLCIVGILAAMYIIGCSDDDKDTTKPPPDTILKVVVVSKTDTTVMVENANVVIYQAETSQAVTRALTGVDGVCKFELDEGNYFLCVTAQGYDASPAPNVTPVPFVVSAQATTEQIRKLNTNETAGSGYIIGTVEPVINNVLIIAENVSDLNKYSGVSGPDGVFIIYNVPFGIYNVIGYKSGYKQTQSVLDTLTAETQNIQLSVGLTVYSGSNYSGKLSFIAGAVAKPTDVVLRDPVTMDIIPGMRVYTNTVNDEFAFNNIPDGDFILWTSLENDSNVMDPDKNLGGINVSFPDDTGDFKQIDITGAINIVSPTNPPDSIYAKPVFSLTPTFAWTKESSYSSVKEYIIEVRDINGRKIWGGFDTDSVIMHEKIPPEAVSFQYPLSAPSLVIGEVYQWKIYADNDDDPDMQGLLSSSEDLMGIFQIKEPMKKK